MFQKDGTESSFIQPKLDIGQPGDRYEQEADRAADAILARNGEASTDSTFFRASPAKGNESVVQHKPVINQVSKGIQRLFDKDIQEKGEEELQKKEDELIQTKSEGEVGNLTSVESKLQNPAQGSVLPEPVKGEMESGFGTDFSGVRVHTDAQAVQMSKDLGAQAFTHGNDIYFNEGKYDTSSNSGKHLLAHELTHTVQQGAAVRPKMIQRNGNGVQTVDPPPGVTPMNESNGEISFSQGNLVSVFRQGGTNELVLPLLSLPRFKERNSNLINLPFVIARNTVSPSTQDEIDAEETRQRDIWKHFIREQSERAVQDKVSEARINGGYSRSQDPESTIYFFKGANNEQFRIFGTESQLLELTMIPSWDESENPSSFQVDHVFETQLGGSNRVSNYELLESSANGSSGAKIMWETNFRVKALYDVLDSDYYKDSARSFIPTLPNRPARVNQFVNLFSDLGYNIKYIAEEYTLTTTGHSDRFWSFGQISQKEHLNKLVPLSGEEMRNEMGTEDDPALFISPTGGNRIEIPEGDAYPVEIFDRTFLLERPDFVNRTMRVDAYGSGESPENTVSATYPNMTWYLEKLPETYTFYVNKQRTIDNALTGSQGVFSSLRLPGMSPIRIDHLDITENGFYGRGKVLPTVPLIRDADIDIVIEGGSIRLRKLFTAQEFNFPSPFEVSLATLEVSFGTDGLGIAGNLDFGINGVGEGHIGAAASTSGGFELEGAFNFDSELFDPAEISVEYRDDVWTIGGEIGIPEGKVRGVKNATITAEYSEGNFTATGEAELDVPGVERGSMTVNYGDEGFSISGEFDLSSDIPGINGGNVEARVAKEEGAENYDVFVSGTAQPAIPGIDTELTVTYENGAITISGEAGYERGLLSGTVNIGATNRPIGEEGEPMGEPDDTMRVYGGGSLTLQLAPWLEATAGVQFLPNGEIEVVGRIGLPSTLDVFDRQEFNRNLFSVPTVEIPLFAIPLGPRSLGLVAQINGGLDFTAGFGPGQLREVFAEVTYNPDRPEETEIHGHGEFAIPADAGLTLRGDLGLGLSAGIASLTGGIELTGTLGLAGEAAAEVDLSYSPQTGIVLNANGRITVNPLFEFTVNALVRATLGVSPFSISEEWRENLAAFEWGPSIQFGIVFPVHYQEDQPFEISTDDVEVIYPDLDVVDMAKDLATDVKDQIF